MEPDASSRPAAPPPAEWRALSRLRERVEEAARELERLRAQNAALAQRVGDLQAQLGSGAAPAGPGLTVPVDDTPSALRARIQGFIDAIDEVLLSPPETGGDGTSDARAIDPPADAP